MYTPTHTHQHVHTNMYTCTCQHIQSYIHMPKPTQTYTPWHALTVLLLVDVRKLINDQALLINPWTSIDYCTCTKEQTSFNMISESNMMLCCQTLCRGWNGCRPSDPLRTSQCKWNVWIKLLKHKFQKWMTNYQMDTLVLWFCECSLNVF